MQENDKIIDEVWFKEFVESYRCRVCKTPLNLDNFGGIYENHGIACKECYPKISVRYF